MDQITWKDELSVGVEKLDQQHQKIIDVLNQLITLINLEVTDESQYSSPLQMMLVSIREHLHFEEYMLKKFNYPDFQAHAQIHEDLFTKLDHYESRLKNLDLQTITELVGYLKGWWIDHIYQTDMKYKDFFNDQQLS